MKRLVGVLLAVGLAAPGVAVVAARPALATDLPTITVGDSSVWEGDAGSVVVSVPVDISAPPATKVKVNYAVTSDTASAPGDFTAKSGTLTFTATALSKPITVMVFGDTNLENDEHVIITLSSPLNATLAKASGGLTILDDDHNGVGPGVEVNIGAVTVVEANAGKHVATIPVTLSRPVNTKVQVVYTRRCGSADGSDYTGKLKGTLTFAANVQTKNITFYVLADLAPETTYESLFDNITVKLGPVVVSQVSGGGTIVDNDAGGGGSTIPPMEPGEIRRASVASDGSEGESPAAMCDGFMPVGSESEVLSANGRYVAFASDADNLVPGDHDLAIDTFVYDTVTATTERVSVQNDGSEFPVDFYSINPWQSSRDQPAISADGRYVTFHNYSDSQVYVRDRVAGTTELISAKPDGSPADDIPGSGVSSISADGRYVAFSSNDPTLVAPAAPAHHSYLYLRDRQLGVTRRIDTYAQFGGGFDDWAGPVISADGNFIAFTDVSSNVFPGDPSGCPDTFVYDVVGGTTERVSETSPGNPNSYASDACTVSRPVISGDGRYVGFTSASADLYGAGASATPVAHSFIRDRLAGTTSLVDDATLYPADQPSFMLGISDDANDVVWGCWCGDPIAYHDGYVPDEVTMYTDRAAGTTTEVGVLPDGTPPIREDNGQLTATWARGGLSADGSIVAFQSLATNLVADDANGVTDVFIQRMY